ncbi:hypothetical protein DMENIID0001_074560 [Sergentomyia squamirostris]
MDEASPGANCKELVTIKSLPINPTDKDDTQQKKKPTLQGYGILCCAGSVVFVLMEKVEKFCSHCSLSLYSSGVLHSSFVLQICKIVETWFQKSVKEAKDVSVLQNVLNQERMMEKISPCLQKIECEGHFQIESEHKQYVIHLVVQAYANQRRKDAIVKTNERMSIRAEIHRHIHQNHM